MGIKIKQVDDLQTTLDAKATKISGGTNGNIVNRDSNGNITDSGKTFNDSGTTTNDIWSANKIQGLINGISGAADALIYKGTVGSGGTNEIAAFNSLATYSIGWTYKVITAGTIKGKYCEPGDMLIAIVTRSGSGNVDADWTVVQNNIGGVLQQVWNSKSEVSGAVLAVGTLTYTPLSTGFILFTINGVVYKKGTYGSLANGEWGYSGTNLQCKMGFAIEATDEIIISYTY